MTANMSKSQLLSPADGKVAETLTDARVLATVAGVTFGNVGEKYLFKTGRSLYGVAVPAAGGAVAYHPAKPDGSADTSAPASQQFRMNRNITRAVGVVGAVAVIEYTNNGPAQYALLGGAAIWFCHLLQDTIPGLR